VLRNYSPPCKYDVGPHKSEGVDNGGQDPHNRWQVTARWANGGSVYIYPQKLKDVDENLIRRKGSKPIPEGVMVRAQGRVGYSTLLFILLWIYYHYLFTLLWINGTLLFIPLWIYYYYLFTLLWINGTLLFIPLWIYYLFILLWIYSTDCGLTALCFS
jgi:hypothetical protein